MKRLTVAIGAAIALTTSGAVLSGTPPMRAGTRAGAAAPSAPTPAELDRLLAPIALYPDALLGQMLLCAADRVLPHEADDPVSRRRARQVRRASILTRRP